MKRVFSIWTVIVLMISLLPVNIVKADTASDVQKAKGYIDAIVQAAPTVEEYVFSEELAEQVDGLERILRDITSSSAVETLDAYVAEKTTVFVDAEETDDPGEVTPGVSEEPAQIRHTYFTSVQEFSIAYSDVQKKELNRLAKPVTQAIQNLLNEPLTKENYAAAQKAYDEADKHVREAVNADDVNAMNQIHELLVLLERADNAFSYIEIPTKNSSADDYDFFKEDYETAKTAYGLYDSKYASLKPKYYVCLQKDSKNQLLDNYEIFAKATFHAEVEQAFDDLGAYDSFTDKVKEKMQALKDAVSAGQTGKYNISVYDYYRGEDIQFVLDEYEHLSELDGMMSLISDMPANKTELTAALRAYRYYNEEMTDKEKSMVPSEYVSRLDNAVLLNTNTEEVLTAIDEIGRAASEEEYENFLSRYEKAYKAYRLFVNTYSGLSDIASLITNVSVLDDSTEVIEMIKSIRQIQNTEDAMMCSKKLQIESALNGYESLSKQKKEAIFNIESLRTIYQDVVAAGALRSKVDVIVNNHSLMDKQYAASLHEEYDKLSDAAKRYFGNDYLKKMQSIDQDLEALNMNAALRVSTLIGQIGKVDVGSKENIDRARNAYDRLTEEQKVYVSDYKTLCEAENAYGALELSVARADVSSLGSYGYSGTSVTPAVTVKLNGVMLTQDLDYRLVYTSNNKVGTAKVSIIGIGHYKGTLTRSFTIRPCTVTGVELSGAASRYSYTGRKIEPSVTASLNGKTLKRGVDYVVSYQNNIKRGTAAIVITGMGNYTGTSKVYFTIRRSTLKKARVTGVRKAYVKTGKPIRPKVKVKIGGVTLKKNRDYRVAYKKNKKRGNAAITIKGTGNYIGTKKIKFKIV